MIGWANRSSFRRRARHGRCSCFCCSAPSPSVGNGFANCSSTFPTTPAPLCAGRCPRYAPCWGTMPRCCPQIGSACHLMRQVSRSTSIISTRPKRWNSPCRASTCPRWTNIPYGWPPNVRRLTGSARATSTRHRATKSIQRPIADVLPPWHLIWPRDPMNGLPLPSTSPSIIASRKMAHALPTPLPARGRRW